MTFGIKKREEKNSFGRQGSWAGSLWPPCLILGVLWGSYLSIDKRPTLFGLARGTSVEIARLMGRGLKPEVRGGGERWRPAQ